MTLAQSRGGRAVLVVVGMAVTAVGVALIVAIITAATTSTQIRGTQVENTVKNDQQTRILKIIRSCTKPGGKCYERGRRQTAGAVADIGRIIIAASACATEIPFDMPIQERRAAITTCVTEQLAARS